MNPTAEALRDLFPGCAPFPEARLFDPAAPLPLLDDLAAAERLAAALDHRVLYVSGLGFLIWTGTHYAEVSAPVLVSAAIVAARQFRAEVAAHAEASGSPASLRPVLRAAETGTFTQACKSVVDRLGTITSAPSESLDRELFLLPVLSGTIDLRTGRLVPHDRRHRFTYVLPVSYTDPEAGTAVPECPRWEAFLESVQPDPEVRAWLQRWAGYGATGDTSEQVYSVFVGQGANGKSVFTDTLAAVLGPITASTSPATFATVSAERDARPDLIRLRASRTIFAAEAGQGLRLDEALLKRWTGQDTISARGLYQAPVTFRPAGKITFVSNSMPRITTDDHGTWRRVQVLTWNGTVPASERVENLSGLLAAEAEGILRWVVAGAVEWYRTGLRTPPSIIAETTRRRDLSDSLAGYVGSVLVESPGSTVTSADALTMYERWADAVSLPEGDRFRTAGNFRAALEERGFVFYKNSVIRIRDAALNPDAILPEAVTSARSGAAEPPTAVGRFTVSGLRERLSEIDRPGGRCRFAILGVEFTLPPDGLFDDLVADRLPVELALVRPAVSARLAALVPDADDLQAALHDAEEWGRRQAVARAEEWADDLLRDEERLWLYLSDDESPALAS
ncbi:MAG: hypothetical protein RL238_2142 [Actinomycetota bacterium]|jgi:P4 family phage/plasmid primase-like protien